MKNTNPMPGGCDFADIIFHEVTKTPIFYPKSVFELGCGNGGNLDKFDCADLRVGVDPLEENIAQATNFDDISVILGDHTYMENFLDNEFDLGITVSVLDHIEDFKVALDEMMRICSELFLLEPTIIGESRQAKKSETSRWENTWYHDYYGYLYKTERLFTMYPKPLYKGNSGNLFHIIHVTCERK